MLCCDCDYCRFVRSFGRGDGGTIMCSKYGMFCDSAHPEYRQCIEDDCDVIWRAAREKGARCDG